MGWFRSRRYEAKMDDFLFNPQPDLNGLSYVDFNTLGTYNAERARGIAHAPEWDEKMAELQARFDAAERERYVQQIVDSYVYGKRGS